jgi:hypothetical protein
LVKKLPIQYKREFKMPNPPYILPRYDELTSINRASPCQEYPGVYLTYTNGKDEKSFSSLAAAVQDACDRVFAVQRPWDYDPNLWNANVCWKCSNNDPRQIEDWFCDFYAIGHYNIAGEWHHTQTSHSKE